MFMGEYNHTIDEKGRIIVPAKLRDELGETFVITKGIDGCLWVYDNEEWEKVEEKINELPFNLKEARLLSRFLIAGAYDAEPDKQGRVMIPQSLREFAGLKRDVVLAGVGKKLELWSKDRYEAAGDYSNVDEIANKLMEFGIRL